MASRKIALNRRQVPASVAEVMDRTGMTRARVVTEDETRGTVYELLSGDYLKDSPSPTGLPILLSYKEGQCTYIPTEEAFELLARTGE